MISQEGVNPMVCRWSLPKGNILYVCGIESVTGDLHVNEQLLNLLGFFQYFVEGGNTVHVFADQGLLKFRVVTKTRNKMKCNGLFRSILFQIFALKPYYISS